MTSLLKAAPVALAALLIAGAADAQTRGGRTANTSMQNNQASSDSGAPAQTARSKTTPNSQLGPQGSGSNVSGQNNMPSSDSGPPLPNSTTPSTAAKSRSHKTPR